MQNHPFKMHMQFGGFNTFRVVQLPPLILEHFTPNKKTHTHELSPPSPAWSLAATALHSVPAGTSFLTLHMDKLCSSHLAGLHSVFLKLSQAAAWSMAASFALLRSPSVRLSHNLLVHSPVHG